MAEKLRTYVIDVDTDQDIVGAAVYLLNSDGSINKQIATTGSDAFFEIDYPPFGQKIQVDFPGYAPATLDPAYISFGGIKLKADPNSTGGEVIVTGIRKKVKKPNYTVPIVLGSAAVVTLGIWLYRKFA